MLKKRAREKIIVRVHMGIKMRQCSMRERRMDSTERGWNIRLLTHTHTHTDRLLVPYISAPFDFEWVRRIAPELFAQEFLWDWGWEQGEEKEIPPAKSSSFEEGASERRLYFNAVAKKYLCRTDQPSLGEKFAKVEYRIPADNFAYTWRVLVLL